MKTKCLAPWFGSNRMLAHRVGELLDGCEWVGIPFCGGLAELPHIRGRTIICSDLHRHVINLAQVVSGHQTMAELSHRIDNLLFHHGVLREAQSYCRRVENGEIAEPDPVNWATAYFTCVWMSRSAEAGTKREFDQQLSLRWNAGGGDSCRRYRSAVESINDWYVQFKRCSFCCLDFHVFLRQCHDKPRHGIYCDPPFIGPGDRYKHTMTLDDHRELRDILAGFQHARIVVRYYDIPEVRELYGGDRWEWHFLEGGRTQANKAAPEVLITNKAEGCDETPTHL